MIPLLNRDEHKINDFSVQMKVLRLLVCPLRSAMFFNSTS